METPSTSDSMSQGWSIGLQNWFPVTNWRHLDFQKVWTLWFLLTLSQTVLKYVYPVTPLHVVTPKDKAHCTAYLSLPSWQHSSYSHAWVLLGPSSRPETIWSPCLPDLPCQDFSKGDMDVLVSTYAWISYEELGSKLTSCNQRINNSLLLLTGVLLFKCFRNPHWCA
jgi:hypothetical protein